MLLLGYDDDFGAVRTHMPHYRHNLSVLLAAMGCGVEYGLTHLSMCAVQLSVEFVSSQFSLVLGPSVYCQNYSDKSVRGSNQKRAE